MRTWIWLAASLACGPMYQSPAGPPPSLSPSVTSTGGPAGASPDPAADPVVEAGAPEAAPIALDPVSAPYAGVASAEPANANRGPARGDTAAWLDAHNGFRARHCASNLTWSAKLAEVAQRWANALRDKKCSFGHSGGDYGENLAAGTSGTLDPASVVKMWYDEIADYRFPDGGFSMKTGHFTQVVWRGTTQVGCGRSQCKGMDIFVCEYSPAGNWEGQYRDNVKPRGCR